MQNQNALWDDKNTLRPVVAVIGEVSCGKSTLLNAMFVNTFSKMKMKRSTMAPTVYLESERPSDMAGFNQQSILDSITKRDEDVGNMTTIPNLDEKVLDFKVPPVVDFGDREAACNYALVDIPGFNDKGQDSVFREWTKKQFVQFDCVIFLIDGQRGMNTKSEHDLLSFVYENILEAKKQYSKDIALLAVLNKVDDPEDEEMQAQKNQAISEVKKVITDWDTRSRNNLAAYAAMSGELSYLYRLCVIRKEPDQFDEKGYARLALNEYGSRWRKEYKKLGREKFFENVSKSLESRMQESGLENPMEECGWTNFVDAFSTLVTSRIISVFENRVSCEVQKYLKKSDRLSSLVSFLDRYILLLDAIKFRTASKKKVVVTVDSGLLSSIERDLQEEVKRREHGSVRGLQELVVLLKYIVRSDLVHTAGTASEKMRIGQFLSGCAISLAGKAPTTLEGVPFVKDILSLLSELREKKLGQLSKTLIATTFVAWLQRLPVDVFTQAIANGELEKWAIEENIISEKYALELAKMKAVKLARSFSYMLSLKKFLRRNPVLTSTDSCRSDLEFFSSILEYPLRHENMEDYMTHSMDDTQLSIEQYILKWYVGACPTPISKIGKTRSRSDVSKENLIDEWDGDSDMKSEESAVNIKFEREGSETGVVRVAICGRVMPRWSECMEDYEDYRTGLPYNFQPQVREKIRDKQGNVIIIRYYPTLVRGASRNHVAGTPMGSMIAGFIRYDQHPTSGSDETTEWFIVWEEIWDLYH